MSKRFKIPPVYLSLIIICAGVAAFLIRIPFLDLMELKTVDLRFRARGVKKPGPEVVLAVIDEKSIDREGKWIWPRKKIADLVGRLSDAGARVIAFDIGFFDPDDNREIKVIRSISKALSDMGIRDEVLTEYLADLSEASDNDRQLAEAIRASKAKVVLGYFFQMSREEAMHLDEDQIKLQESCIQSSRIKMVRFASEDAFRVPFPGACIPESNIPVISYATPYSGFFNMRPDADGVIRWIPGMIKYHDALYAHLSLEVLAAYLNQPLVVNVADYGIESLDIGGFSIPTDELGRIMINYRGGFKTFPSVSATDILHDRVPADRLKDKIVLVGVTAVGVYDLRVTPFENEFPGVAIHANLIDSILSGDFLFQPAWAAFFDILAMLLGGVFLGLIIPRVKVVPGVLAALSMLVGYVYACYWFFAEKGMVLNVVYPVAVIALVYTVVSAYRYLAEEGQKRFIRDAFSRYVSPTVVRQLIESPERLVLGGEKREITAFFSDLEGFTGISEKLSPEALVELLNEFLTEMAGIIQKYNGTVDKFEGDAIIAMFGAPITLDNHAESACRACIEMQERLAVLGEKWQALKGLAIRMRIGMCSGQAVVGNMGSKDRFDYTMMGDTVNAAARLEGINKVYGTYTAISESTYNLVGDHRIVARELDLVRVMGKAAPVRVYQLVGYRDRVDANFLKTVDFYRQGLYEYRNRRWDRAVELFNKALEATPGDPPARVMVRRCMQYQSRPPGADWNGVFVAEAK